jgi:hypothetical protein
MSPPVFSFGGLNAFALENDGLESVSGRIIRWVARKSRLAGKDDWTARTPQPEQVHRNCCKIPLALIEAFGEANEADQVNRLIQARPSFVTAK